MLDDGTTAPPDCVTLLGLDHRRLDAILADVKRWLATGDLQRAQARFSAFRNRLEHHIVVEEEILFPTFEALTGASGVDPTHVMRMEHAEIRRLMAELASNLERGGDEEHTAPLAALTARVCAHSRKEERIFYPATEQAACDARRAGDSRRVEARRPPRAADRRNSPNTGASRVNSATRT
jgi:hemerythrin-like domain-containing protein